MSGTKPGEMLDLLARVPFPAELRTWYAARAACRGMDPDDLLLEACRESRVPVWNLADWPAVGGVLYEYALRRGYGLWNRSV